MQPHASFEGELRHGFQKQLPAGGFRLDPAALHGAAYGEVRWGGWAPYTPYTRRVYSSHASTYAMGMLSDGTARHVTAPASGFVLACYASRYRSIENRVTCLSCMAVPTGALLLVPLGLRPLPLVGVADWKNARPPVHTCVQHTAHDSTAKHSTALCVRYAHACRVCLTWRSVDVHTPFSVENTKHMQCLSYREGCLHLPPSIYINTYHIT
jgi:hypothetical protein